jgi:hypothetical protein
VHIEIITQLILQLNALILLLLKAQKLQYCTFRLSSPYMFQPAWVILRGAHIALLKLLKIKNYGSLELC